MPEHQVVVAPAGAVAEHGIFLDDPDGLLPRIFALIDGLRAPRVEDRGFHHFRLARRKLLERPKARDRRQRHRDREPADGQHGFGKCARIAQRGEKQREDQPHRQEHDVRLRERLKNRQHINAEHGHAEQPGQPFFCQQQDDEQRRGARGHDAILVRMAEESAIPSAARDGHRNRRTGPRRLHAQRHHQRARKNPVHRDHRAHAEAALRDMQHEERKPRQHPAVHVKQHLGSQRPERRMQRAAEHEQHEPRDQEEGRQITPPQPRHAAPVLREDHQPRAQARRGQQHLEKDDRDDRLGLQPLLDAAHPDERADDKKQREHCAAKNLRTVGGGCFHAAESGSPR